MTDDSGSNPICASLFEHYSQVRKQTEALCQPLLIEDYVIQSMEDVSPPKWHIAHVSWFFETFILQPFVPDYRPFDARFASLFNSYYNGIGKPFPRPRRGLLSRPCVAEIYRYRAYVDQYMEMLTAGLEEHPDAAQIQDLITLGLHHEQQHQELLLTDIKHIYAQNPLNPAYRENITDRSRQTAAALQWRAFPEAEIAIGHQGNGFHFDNEAPRHRVLIAAFSLANRAVTNGEYLQFIDAGGYENPLLWLSDGWTASQKASWQAPLYWRKIDGHWHCMTLQGLLPLDKDQPVCHVSYYEANAFATWAGKRLPTEREWEYSADGSRIAPGNFMETGCFHPRPAAGDGMLQQFGDVWEWTQSPYTPYPGYRAAAGAIGEYNGKFMCNQMVLRGGSCATPAGHIRKTYRNFFYPHNRWQFMGFRLADDR